MRPRTSLGFGAPEVLHGFAVGPQDQGDRAGQDGSQPDEAVVAVSLDDPLDREPLTGRTGAGDRPGRVWPVTVS